MKNVLRRAIELLNLLSDNENLTTENIKDSISDYRDLNQQKHQGQFPHTIRHLCISLDLSKLS